MLIKTIWLTMIIFLFISKCKSPSFLQRYTSVNGFPDKNIFFFVAGVSCSTHLDRLHVKPKDSLFVEVA